MVQVGMIFPYKLVRPSMLFQTRRPMLVIVWKSCFLFWIKVGFSIAKQKIQLTPDIDVDALLVAVKEKYAQYDITDIDGVKIDFPDRWVHLRKSNTEPIIRVYSEARTPELAEETAAGVMAVIAEMAGK